MRFKPRYRHHSGRTHNSGRVELGRQTRPPVILSRSDEADWPSLRQRPSWQRKSAASFRKDCQEPPYADPHVRWCGSREGKPLGKPSRRPDYTKGLSSALGNGSSRPKRYEPANPEANPAAAPSATDHANPRARWVNWKVTHIRNPVRAPKSTRLRTRNSERCPHRPQMYKVEKTSLGERAGALQCGQVFMKCVRWYNVAHQPPRANGHRHETVRSSRGWLHVLVGTHFLNIRNLSGSSFC